MGLPLGSQGSWLIPFLSFVFLLFFTVIGLLVGFAINFLVRKKDKDQFTPPPSSPPPVEVTHWSEAHCVDGDYECDEDIITRVARAQEDPLDSDGSASIAGVETAEIGRRRHYHTDSPLAREQRRHRSTSLE